MLRLGYKASAEQFAPRELVDYAVLAEELGYDSVVVSDHFQPWRHDGGHSPFSFAWLAAVGERTSRIQLGTSVVAPSYRYHPGIVAQAMATLGCLYPGRVMLGVGTGEAMNEVPLGIHWPEQKVRFQRLKEACQLMRRLWSEDRVSFDGDQFRTHDATVYDKPVGGVPLYIAASGPAAARLAGRMGDGFITTSGKDPALYADKLLPAVREGAEKDLSWSDTANDVVARMWRLLGGYGDHGRACDWMLVLRPGRWVGSALWSLVRRRGVRRDVVPVGALPLHAAGSRLVARAFPRREPGVAGKLASVEEITEHAPMLAERGWVRVAHDAAYLEHVFALVERTTGPLVRRLVRRAGRPIGWYAYVDRGEASSRVLHLAARDAHLDAVVGELVDHARQRGRAVLSGRFEAHLEEPLRRRLAVLGLARRPMMHARDDGIAATLGAGSALITQLDGEWYVV